MAAHQRDTDIPDNWALDADRTRTRSPGDALIGTMMLLGEARDTALAIMVEILAAGIIGSNYSLKLPLSSMTAATA
ncbi:Ldh family oxidoreductase [Rhizobium sp. BK418]|uniref:Ldh family oxidoreductase n=1 Tax=Rhizobium sp. BK418 TaxID=2512120 RepID=UPI00104726C7|nr:Ldh family oxidoreductase [Rhizobium sp. BK418]